MWIEFQSARLSKREITSAAYVPSGRTSSNEIQMMKLRIQILTGCICILLLTLSAGCILPDHYSENNSLPDFMPGMFDTGFFSSPPNTSSYTHAIDWYFDLDNATGFVSVQRRDDRSNQIPIYIAEPGVEGRIAIEIKASGEDIIVTLNRTFPMSPLSEGMSLTLEGEPIYVKNGETADATLILRVDPSTVNTVTHTVVWLETTSGWGRARVCQVYSAADPNRPDI